MFQDIKVASSPLLAHESVNEFGSPTDKWGQQWNSQIITDYQFGAEMMITAFELLINKVGK